MEKNLIKKFRNRRKVKSLGKTKKVGRRGDRLVAKTNRTLKRYRGGDDSDYAKNKKGLFKTGRFSNDPNTGTRTIGQTSRMISKGVRRNVTNFYDGQYNKDVLAIDPTLEKTLKAKLYEYAYQYRDLLIRKYENDKNAKNDLKARSDNFKKFKIWLLKRRGNLEYQHKFDDDSYDETFEELNNYLKEKNTEIANATKKIDDIRLQSGQPGLSAAEQALTILQRDLGRIEEEIKGLDESRKKYTDECTSISDGIQEFQTAFVEWAKGLSTDQDATVEQDALKAFETKILDTKILTKKEGNEFIDSVTEKLDEFAKTGTDSSAGKVKNEKELPKKRAELAKMVEEKEKIEKKKKDFETRQTELTTAGKREGTEYANTKILLKEIGTDLEKIIEKIDTLQQEISVSETAIKSHGDTTNRNEVTIQLLTNYRKTKERADKEAKNNKTKQGSKLVFVLQLLSRSKTLLEYNSAPSSFFSKRLYPIWLDSMDVLRKIVFSTFTTRKDVQSTSAITTTSDDSSTPAIIGAILAAVNGEGGYIAGTSAPCTISHIIIPEQEKGSFPQSNEKRYLVIYKDNSGDTFLGITEKNNNNNVTVKVIAKVVTSETQYIEQNDYSAQKNFLSDYNDPNANPKKMRCKITEMVTLLDNRDIDTKAILYFIKLQTKVKETPPKKPTEDSKEQAAKLRAEYNGKSDGIVKEWFLMIEQVYAPNDLAERKDIVDLYIKTNNTMHLTLSIPDDGLDNNALLNKLQDDFIKVIKGQRADDESCDTSGPGTPKVKRPMDPSSKEYKVNVNFYKRLFYELDPETGEPILDASGNPKTIIPTDDDPPFYHVQSNMLKKGKKYRGRSAFFAHMLDDFKTAEMSLWFLRHPDHKNQIAATRETVNVISEDDTKAINKQNKDERTKFAEMQTSKETSYKNKLAEETTEYEKERPIRDLESAKDNT